MYYYLSLMKFDDGLRFALEYSLYEIIEMENDYRILIPLSKETFEKLNNKFYEEEE